MEGDSENGKMQLKAAIDYETGKATEYHSEFFVSFSEGGSFRIEYKETLL